MKTREAFIIGTAAGAVVGGLSWYAAQKVSQARHAEALMVGERFPTITGKLLSGESMTIPDDLAGKAAILVTGWSYGAAPQSEEWTKAIQNAYGQQEGLELLAVPFISGVYALAHKRIDAAMKRHTSEEEQRHTLTVYGADLATLRKRLGASKEPCAYIYVLGQDGTLVWRGEGEATQEQMQSLAYALLQLGINRQNEG